MPRIPVVALASTLMLAGLAVACRDGIKAPAEPIRTAAPTLMPNAPSGPYRSMNFMALVRPSASQVASHSRSTASPLKANFTVVTGASDATTMIVNGSTAVTGEAIAKGGVAGELTLSDNSTQHAIFWSLTSNSGVDLGTFGGGVSSRGLSINDKNDVAGWSDTLVQGVLTQHAFLATAAGALKDLGTFTPSDPTAWSVGLGVNNSGQVVGAAREPDITEHAFLWDASTGMRDLGCPGNNDCRPIGITDDGTVVGWYYSPDVGDERVWTWRDGDQQPHDLPIFPGAIVYPLHVNAVGQISGFTLDMASGTLKGFVYTPGANPVTFGSALMTVPWGLNNHGDAVGYTTNDGQTKSPLLWSAYNGLTDLSSMLPSIANLMAINDDEVAVTNNQIYTLAVHPSPLAAVVTAQTALNTPVAVTVSASDPDGDAVTYDSTTAPQHGTVSGTGPNYTYTPNTGFSGADSFTYWVSDSYNAKSAGTVTITVISNRPPIANAGGNTLDQAGYTGDEGSAIAFNGSGSSDPDNDPITYAWSFGDGATASVANPTHAYADNGTYTAKLTVTDSHGASSWATAQVVVSNVAPTGTFSAAPASVNEGSAFTLAIANPTDVSSADQKAGFTYSFDCGTGTYGDYGSSASMQCATVDNGTLVVHGRLRDKDGGVTAYESHVTVNNVAPTVTAPATATLYSGDTYTLVAGFSDPGVKDAVWTYSVSWGTGSPTNMSTSSQGTISATSPRYLAAGAYTVSLKVTDKDNGFNTATTTLTVLRLPVGLDVSPGDPSNAIKLNEHSGKDVLVAVLSSASFDAQLVDVGSVRIGGASVAKKGNGSYVTSVEDVNGDGRLDLVLHFNLSDLMSVGGLNANSKSLTLLANLTDGRQITGTDVVKPM